MVEMMFLVGLDINNEIRLCHFANQDALLTRYRGISNRPQHCEHYNIQIH